MNTSKRKLSDGNNELLSNKKSNKKQRIADLEENQQQPLSLPFEPNDDVISEFDSEEERAYEVSTDEMETAQVQQMLINWKKKDDDETEEDEALQVLPKNESDKAAQLTANQIDPLKQMSSSEQLRSTQPLAPPPTTIPFKDPISRKIMPEQRVISLDFELFKSVQQNNSSDMWDSIHVRLPCSSSNTYMHNRTKKNLSTWYLIQTALTSQPICNTFQLEEAISSYSSWDDFVGLHVFINEIATEDEAMTFLTTTLPYIIKLALQLPELCKDPIPILLPNVEKIQQLVLNQHQVARCPKTKIHSKNSFHSSRSTLTFATITSL